MSNIFHVPVGCLYVFLEKYLFSSSAYFSIRFPFLDVDLLQRELKVPYNMQSNSEKKQRKRSVVRTKDIVEFWKNMMIKTKRIRAADCHIDLTLHADELFSIP